MRSRRPRWRRKKERAAYAPASFSEPGAVQWETLHTTQPHVVLPCDRDLATKASQGQPLQPHYLKALFLPCQLRSCGAEVVLICFLEAWGARPSDTSKQ